MGGTATPTAINRLTTDRQAEQVEIYSIDGMRLTNSVMRGTLIEVHRKSDGSVEVRKVKRTVL